MTRIAFDSSALAKRYIAESGTQRMTALCQAADEVIVSVLCLPEILSALNRLRREESLLDEQYSSLKADLIADLAEASVVTITEPLLAYAIRVLESMPLRTLDAIHIATAMETQCDLFVSADQRQCQAAAVFGLKVENVG